MGWARVSGQKHDEGGAVRICVVGSGVIGTIYGSVLSKAGHDITH